MQSEQRGATPPTEVRAARAGRVDNPAGAENSGLGKGSALADATAVLVTAGRLIARHWPVLLALAFAGLAARELLMTAAVRTSKLHGVAGFLVLVLVPIATLSAQVIMLRTVRASLPLIGRSISTAGSVTGDRSRRLVDHIGSVLVPFLAVYASYGYLRQDISQYFYRVFADEVFNNPDSLRHPERVDVLGRLPVTIGAVLISVVLATVVLRWAFSRWSGASRRPWLGFVGGYLEVVWITLVAGTVTVLSGRAGDWAADRRAVRWAQSTWNDATAALGPLGRPLHATVSWLWSQLGYADTVIAVPVAWLAVGAIVYGYSMPRVRAPLGPTTMRAARRWAVLPPVLRRAIAVAGAHLAARFGPLVQGVRLLARAGLRPMLLFCLAFVVAQTAADWLWQAERLLLGPHDIDGFWRPVAGPLSALNAALGSVLLTCLLAAAVDRVVRTAAEPAAAPAVAAGVGRSADSQPGVPRQLGGEGDADGDRPGRPGRDEVGHGLVR